MQPDVKVGRTKKLHSTNKKVLQKFVRLKIKLYLCTVIEKQTKTKTT